MAQKVLILGDSGTGKSASMRNFKPDEVLVINAAGKALPFKNHFEVVNPSFEKLTSDVMKAMDATDKKVIVVDDAQYIMSFQYMRRIKESGWDKWNDIQGDFFNIIKHVDDLPTDVVVYFLSHLQRDDEGHEKIKTMGKMLDEKITIEGLFTIVLKTSVTDGNYVFLTQNSGMDTVKSPIGMFDSYAIDNDLKYVDTKIRNYYEIGDYVPDEAVAAMDAEVAKPEVTKPDPDGRKRRARKERNEEKEELAETPTEEKKEEAAEQPKRRSRKERTEATEANSSAVNAEAEEVTTAPKRRRRKTKEEIDAFMNIDTDDVEIPFD